MRKNNISDIIKKFTAAAVSASLLFSVCPAELLAGTPQFEKQAAETLRQISAEQKHYQDMIKREEQKQSDYYRSSKRESGVKRYNSMLPGVGVKKMLMTDSQTQKYIEVLKYDDKLRKDDVFRRAEEIKNTLLEWEENPEDAANQGPYTFEEFQAKYNQSVKEQEKKLLAQINKFEEDQKKDIEEKSAAYARYNEYTPQMVASWRSIIESSLSKAVSEMKQDLASAKQNSLSKVQPEYRKYSEDFKTESSMQEQRFFEALKALVQELMDLFNKYPEKIEPYVIELSPVLLVADGQQNIVFTRAQKDMLLRLYKNFIKTKDEDCDKWGICDLQVNALSGIGMLGKYSDDANAITDFIESHEKDPAYSKILITGAAALLAMDDYGRLNSYLERVSRRESKTDFDMLSFSNSTDAYNVRNGNYLGEVSKYAAYRENGGLDNAYTQIAIMLAQKNTQGSLSILENQGVNKCAVYTVYEDSDSKQPDQMRMAADPLYTGAVVANTIYNTKKQQKIECYGILPFLDGALLSGLSGADKYDPPYSVAGQQNMWQAGLTTVTPQEAANSQRAAQNMKWAFSAYAADRKISKEAALALYIINQDMGDLDVQSEQYIDEQLYAKYKNELSSPGLLNEFAIIKDLPANIQKKNSRLAAAKIRSKIAAGADIAVTAWCLYDMSKLAVKGGRAVTKLISGGGSKAWRIAEVLYYGRGGNTVRKMAFLRENVAMYKKVFAGRKNPSLIVKVGERIRNGMEPVFLEQSKQYGALPYKTGPRSLDGALKPDNVETILKHTSFNGEEFIIDSRSVYKEINGAKNLESDIIGVEKVLKDGIKNTPEKFGKYSMSARPITGSGAVSKRPVLNNLKTNYNNFLGNEILASDAEKALLSAGVANLETAENFAAGIRNSGALPLKAAKYSDKLLNTKFARGEANHLKLFNIYKKTHETTNGEKVLLEEPVKIEKTVKGVRVLLDEPINGINHSFWDWRIFDPLKDTKFIKNKRLPNISSVALNQETGFLEFVGTNGKDINSSFFKVGIKDESFPSVVEAIYNAQRSEAGFKNMELKLIASDTEGQGFLAGMKRGLRNKNKMFTETLPVIFRGEEIPSSVLKLKADASMKGYKVFIQDNAFSLVKDGKTFGGELSWQLPKEKMPNFISLTKKSKALFKDNPVYLGLYGSKNKISTLFWLSALSLSAASTSLIKPLDSTWPEAPRSAKFGITVAIPYAASFLSPIISPFIKRYGMERILSGSLLAATGALILPPLYTAITGQPSLTGFGNITPDNKPSLMPLMISSALVGVSTAMTRATLPQLIDAIGGGGHMLKSMGYKNLSSFIMIIPPALVNGAYYLSGGKNENISYVNDSSGKPVRLTDANAKMYADQKPFTFRNKPTDFALSYPVLAAASLGAYFWLKKTRINPNIGKIESVILKDALAANTPEAVNILKNSGALNKKAPVMILKDALAADNKDAVKILQDAVAADKTEAIDILKNAVTAKDKRIVKIFGKDVTFNEETLNILKNYAAANDKEVIGILKDGVAPGVVKEAAAAFKVTVNKNVWPVIGAGAFLVGSEAAIVNSYSMKEVNRYVSDVNRLYSSGAETKEQEGPWTEDARGLTAVALYIAAPLIFRLNSDGIIKVLGGKTNPVAYKKLLTGSIITAAVGTGILARQDNTATFGAGMALASIGFASTTNGFMKLGKMNLESAKAAKTMITNFETLYPAVHVGMAAVPLLTTAVADNNAKAYSGDNKSKPMQNALWVPGVTLAVGGLFGAKAIGLGGLMKTSKVLKNVSPLISIPAGLSAGYNLMERKKDVFSERGGLLNAEKHTLYNPVSDVNVKISAPKLKINGDLLKNYDTAADSVLQHPAGENAEVNNNTTSVPSDDGVSGGEN